MAMLGLLLLDVCPGVNTVQVETVRALSPNHGAIIAGNLAIRTARIECPTTNSTRTVATTPSPIGHEPCSLNGHLHLEPSTSKTSPAVELFNFAAK
eukprot:CAMPEP_0184745670 /NCGR_PEP_ID=MMETSP0315-20130426/8352_1 /TAXON_ID=101924 /ORGANISM="Rhodosorus marinus, Strain UTEX LB 2760" /LENGTH=95 /DNA_ID=CAMNT_0027217959 /DNA_START=325 /DNA_END=609 /DNA_ORIENTATION=+